MAEEMYRQAAKSLAENSVDLIRHIVEKHDAAILEEMHSQLKKRDIEIKQLKLTIGKLTCWMGRELGEAAVTELMKELDT